MRRVCVCGECIDPLPPQQKFSICLNQDTVVQACYFAAWLPDEAPGEHTVGKTRDGVGQGLPIFIISLRKLSLLNYLHALFDKNWNFKIEKRRWERGKEDQGGGTEHLRDGTEKQRQTGSRKRDIIETDGERGICCVEG